MNEDDIKQILETCGQTNPRHKVNSGADSANSPSPDGLKTTATPQNFPSPVSVSTPKCEVKLIDEEKIDFELSEECSYCKGVCVKTLDISIQDTVKIQDEEFPDAPCEQEKIVEVKVTLNKPATKDCYIKLLVQNQSSTAHDTAEYTSLVEFKTSEMIKYRYFELTENGNWKITANRKKKESSSS